MTGRFIEKDGRLVWREVREEAVADVGAVYLCHKPGDPDHLVYKLTKTPHERGGEDGRYFWAALWNTCANSGVKVEPGHHGRWQNYWALMEDAIRDKLANGWVVWPTTFTAAFGGLRIPSLCERSEHGN